MNTYIWGPEEWAWINEAARLFQPDYKLSLFRLGVPPEVIEILRKCFVGMLWSQQWILPCLYCRRSFRELYRGVKPERVKAKDLPRLASRLHDLVNTKLGTDAHDVNFERFHKRMLTWTVMISDASLWDLLGILFLNYPKSDEERRPHEAADEEAQQKREAYLEFLACSRALVRFIPHLASMRNFIPLPRQADRPWASRAEAYAAYVDGRDRWAATHAPQLLNGLRASHRVCQHDCSTNNNNNNKNNNQSN